MSFSFQNLTRKKIILKQELFKKIKEKILGEVYELSLNFIGDQKSKKLNLKYRNGNYIPNVLSFPLDKKNGEIFINPNQAKREHKKFEMTYQNFLIYLFIHGCLHLTGLNHGKKMEAQEQELLKKFAKN